MSASIPAPPAPTVRDKIISASNSFPDLVSRAELLDPPLAKALTGQAQAASATPVGSLIASGISAVVTYYGLHWDPAFVGLLSGALILVGGYATHMVQRRVVSLKPSPTVPEGAAP